MYAYIHIYIYGLSSLGVTPSSSPGAHSIVPGGVDCSQPRGIPVGWIGGGGGLDRGGGLLRRFDGGGGPAG